MAEAGEAAPDSVLQPGRPARRWTVLAAVLGLAALAGLAGLACALVPALGAQAWVNRRPAAGWRTALAIAAALTAGGLAYGLVLLFVWLWRPGLFGPR